MASPLPDRPSRRPAGTAASLLRLSALGVQFAFSVFIGFGIGYFLDRWLHTRPWLMIVFLLLGIAAGFVSVARAARADENDG